jgi:hypothetical protein
MTHELGTMVDGVFSCVSLFSLSLSPFGSVVVRSLGQITSAAQKPFSNIFFFFQKERNKFRFYTVVVVVVVVVLAY